MARTPFIPKPKVIDRHNRVYPSKGEMLPPTFFVWANDEETGWECMKVWAHGWDGRLLTLDESENEPWKSSVTYCYYADGSIERQKCTWKDKDNRHEWLTRGDPVPVLPEHLFWKEQIKTMKVLSSTGSTDEFDSEK